MLEVVNVSELALKSPIKPSKELLSASDDGGGGILASMVSHHSEIYNSNNAGSQPIKKPIAACMCSLFFLANGHSWPCVSLMVHVVLGS